MRKILERYIPATDDHYERFHISRVGKRPGMPLNLRGELPEILSAIEIAGLWVADEDIRGAIEQAITAAAKAGKLKAGWYDHLIQRTPPKVTTKTLPVKESNRAKPGAVSPRRKGELPPPRNRGAIPGKVGSVKRADITKRVPLIHRDDFRRWLKAEGEPIKHLPGELARWVNEQTEGEQDNFTARADALRAVVAELQAEGRDLAKLTRKELFEGSKSWRRKARGDDYGFRASFHTWIRDFWKKGGSQILKAEK